MSEKDRKLVEAITPRDEDFAQWYTDIVKKADLIDYSSVRGCMIIRPYGYAIWELIQKHLDKRFKETGHENVYMPLFIPESLLQKEKDHVEGFAPEVAWVTHGGDEELTERLCVRPTSETLFCEHYANTIHSYRDLPKLYNQWCSVVRWEKPPARSLEHWSFVAGRHTAHATEEESMDETIKMLNVYAEFCENILAIPVVKGRKTDKEKFAGAKATFTIESLMHDGKALQTGTSHNFGDGFARAFNIRYTDKNNELKYVHQTSWGMTTRLIGALIMVHGDDDGLVLPPEVAPVQVMVIPVQQHKEGVLEKAREVKSRIEKLARVGLDDSDKMPGWKFSEYEMKGVPLRLEIGPKDIQNNQCVIVRRDTREKIFASLDNLEDSIQKILKAMQRDLLANATRERDRKTYTAYSMDEFAEICAKTPGFIKAMWCGERSCEDAIKEKTGATARCIPFEQDRVSDSCVCCGKPAEHLVIWGKAY